LLTLQEDIANSIFGGANASEVLPTTSMSKDYKAVLSRYLPSNGPRASLTTLSEHELDRKYGQILTRCLPATPLFCHCRPVRNVTQRRFDENRYDIHFADVSVTRNFL